MAKSNETKDQTIARLTQEIREANSKTAAFCGEVVSLLAELAGNRADVIEKAIKGYRYMESEYEYKKRLESLIVPVPAVRENTLVEIEESYDEANALRAAEEIAGNVVKHAHATGIMSGINIVRSILLRNIPQTDATALAERDRRLVEAATLREHANHVQFLNELYATLVDPLADGPIKESDLMKSLLESARWYRDKAHELENTERNRRIRLEVVEDTQSFYNESNMRYSEEFEVWLKNKLTMLRAPVPAEGEK